MTRFDRVEVTSVTQYFILSIRHTLNYINETGRFRHIYGNISAELMEDNEQE